MKGTGEVKGRGGSEGGEGEVKGTGEVKGEEGWMNTTGTRVWTVHHV